MVRPGRRQRHFLPRIAFVLVIFSVSVLYFSGNEKFEDDQPGFTKWNQRTLLVEYEDGPNDEVTDGQK